MRQFFLTAISSLFFTLLLGAESVRSDHTEAELVAEVDGIEAGQAFWMALRLKMDDHWHTYWVNPGEAGLKTELKWTELPKGFEAGDFHWPPPKRYLQEDIMNYVYEDEVFLLFEVTAPKELQPGTELTFKARADWLECDPSMCVPGGADLSLTLPVVSEKAQWSDWHEDFEKTRESWPKDLSANWSIGAQLTDDRYTLTLTPKTGANSDPGEVYFYSSAAQVTPSAKQFLTKDSGSYQLSLEKDQYYSGDLDTLPGDLYASNGWLADGSDKFMLIAPVVGAAAIGTGSSVSSAEAAVSTNPLGLGSLLGLAFVGGLILNLMPCVFPVLGLKIMSFVNQAGEERGKIVLHGLVFTAGVLISFWILAGVLIALRTGGEELGWGFQLQSPGFVLALAVILLIFGLNMSGLFEIGTSAVGVGSNLTGKSGVTGSFFSGVLATVVATPCAAPFLAPALGGALTLPPVQSIAVFTAIGVGLSGPYLLLSAFPSMIKLLPRPGAWMETFKQFMAFLLYGTVVALAWVLAGQVGAELLLSIFISLVIIAMGCWVYGRWAAPHKKTGVKWAGRLVALALVGLPLAYVYAGISEEAREKALIEKIASGEAEQDFLIWEKWTPEKEAKLREEGRFVYIDFTARWCATCQVNKKAYSNQEVIDAFLKNNVALLKADWTNQDPAITQELAKFNRSAVPFNLIYSPDREEPVIMPELITPGIVLEKLKEAGAS
ncbi:protein-disulfide reductase DsbD family protein [Rubellicoccus peritrichatus]|uniref:Protein-disulfide reductase DsbD family protein n=1 Tax=Rubellicoccus peritrichatus TaxID=3080537 RepID=A0AAQ3QTY3_9BACT|nr:thioredoxin family protein [Puniceicoccus sp. CR14]WOO41836.1 protein-disulfide reductase DsbD family protein [Puniceicoccus sp. CR14]